MAIAYLGLGANLGRPRDQLVDAIRALAKTEHIRVTAVSSLYGSKPEGGLKQPDYINAVIALETALEPRALWAKGKALEVLAGRVPAERNAPRVLDLDLLLYDDCICLDPELVIPHPRLAQRAFVAVPLAEIAPGLKHPGLGKTLSELAASLSKQDLWVVQSGGSWANL